MRIAVRHRTLWMVVAALAGALFICCVGFGIGFIFGNFFGSGRAVSPDDLPGTYRDDHYGFDRTEVLVLRADGAFEETFTSEAGASYANGGRWRAEVDGGKVIVFLDNAIIYSLLEPPLTKEWRLRARRGLRGGLSLSAGDPDGIIELHKTE